MARNTAWQDDYWLPVMQLYLSKPVGVKATYSREVVGLSLELHVAPEVLVERLKQVATLSKPRVERIWRTYADSPRRLARAVRLWREMQGFGQADMFYSGVEVTETFERDFRPLAEEPALTPVALIMILDLYFRLTPITMVAETPEVVLLARQLKVSGQLVVDVLRSFQLCDPYLNRKGQQPENRLLPACKEIWQRYGNGDARQLADFAKQLSAYFK